MLQQHAGNLIVARAEELGQVLRSFDLKPDRPAVDHCAGAFDKIVIGAGLNVDTNAHRASRASTSTELTALEIENHIAGSERDAFAVRSQSLRR